jgi:ligand-binding sensor domain-containing protein
LLRRIWVPPAGGAKCFNIISLPLHPARAAGTRLGNHPIGESSCHENLVGLDPAGRITRGCAMRALRSLLLLTILAAAGAGPARGAWWTYTVADGLSSNYSSCAVEDRAGGIWFGGAGATRYDGITWHTYPAVDGRTGSPVRSSATDRDGNLWFGTNYGVTRFDGVSWRTYTTGDGLVFNQVRAIKQDRMGAMWFGTHAGASRFDGTTWRTYTKADGLADSDLSDIALDHDGNLWFLTVSAGVSRFDGVSWRTYTTADGLADNRARAMSADTSGNLWFGTYGGGVSRYDGVAWRTFTKADGLASDSVYAVLVDRAGDVWCGTESHGVSRYDGTRWTTFTTEDGLANNSVTKILQDRRGNLWFLTYGGGVSRFDGSTWRTYTEADGVGGPAIQTTFKDHQGNLWIVPALRGVTRYDGSTWTRHTVASGLPSDWVLAVAEDSTHNVWVGTEGAGAARFNGVWWQGFTSGGGNRLARDEVRTVYGDRNGNVWFGYQWSGGGVTRFDGVAWRTFTTADGLIDDNVYACLQDRAGGMWFGTMGGVSRYDGSGWRSFTTANGLASNKVHSLLEDRQGNLWVGTWDGGVSRFDGSSWWTYSAADGALLSNNVTSILEDRDGLLWFGTDGGGVSRFDGQNWGTYTTNDGLPSIRVMSAAEAFGGKLWFGTYGSGVSCHEPDRVPPEAVVWPPPPALLSGRSLTITYAAALREASGVTFSSSFDGSPWSGWSPTTFWQGGALTDGVHEFRVRARDLIGNVTSDPATRRFEIDASPPVPMIAAPASGQVVRGPVIIRGTAADLRFRGFRLEARSTDAPAWALLAESSAPIPGGLLGGWDTAPLADGEYELRLSVTDTLGLVGSTLVRVIVDNHAPWAEQTSPARITAEKGGDAYSSDGTAHLYFPPRAFTQDAVVTASGLGRDSLSTIPAGAGRFLHGCRIGWSGASLRRPGNLDFPDTLAGAQADSTPAVYRCVPDSTWSRVGGTRAGSRISVSLQEPGLYAVFVEGPVAATGGRALAHVALTPRVFSPSGTYASQGVAVSFTLGQAAPVTVKVHDRAGRLVRQVESARELGAGANVLRWDGRDADGEVAGDGIYLISVEAFGKRETRTVAVVR